MSDQRDNRPDDKKPKTKGNDKTLIRGQDQVSSEPNDDETIVRQSPAQASEPNDDETRIKAPLPEPDENQTIVRSKRQPAVPDDKNRITSEQLATEARNDNETIIRGAGKTSASGEATILRGPESDTATILRGPSDDSATLMGRRSDLGDGDVTNLRDTPRASDKPARKRPPPKPQPPLSFDDDDDKTVIVGEGDDATVVKDSISEDETVIAGGDDDATVINVGYGDDDATIIGGSADDDATVLNDGYGDDATVMGPESGQDTTYIASVGRQIRPQGNSEAGRLLKNRFVLEEKIGSGGMGDVYKALDLRQQEAQERDPYIAIKLLNENFSRHKDAFLSLQRETSRTRGIPHPNIMGVYDFDREGDTVFMSMELLDGKPLDDYLKEHPEGVSQEDAWNIIDGISKGLMRAHDAGIVHSDFKPGNIFYTKDKTAKVFDFGIARAVSNPGELEADGEKTVFDAGSLGALTPTYASYEMLKGLEPSKSDDVYAVALVAYELFMGKHPYDRVPADKALERGLTPKPVPFLKRRHWKALKKALSLKGENRTQTIDEFHEGMFSEDPPYFRYSAAAVLIIGSISFATYQTLNVKEKPLELIEWEASMSAAEITLDSAINKARRQDEDWSWEQDSWHEQLQQAVPRWRLADSKRLENETWVEDFELEESHTIDAKIQSIAEIYLDKISSMQNVERNMASGGEELKDEELGAAAALKILEEAKHYHSYLAGVFRSGSPKEVDQIGNELDVKIALRSRQIVKIEEDARIAEELRLANEARLEAEKRAVEIATARFNAYEKDAERFKEIMKCKGDIENSEIAELGQRFTSMRAGWPEAWESQYDTIVEYLGICIQQRIGYAKPERAREVLARVVGFFPGEERLANIVIEDKDPCAERRLEGRGNLGRNFCRDGLSEGGDGPELVVIPGRSGGFPKFAISRAEIKVHEYNEFCTNAGCPTIAASSSANSLPVTNISFEQAQEYANWLSQQTGEVYRIPTVAEWEHATRTNKEFGVDQNINCTVDSRGVKLGETLQNAVSGRANPWGLFNFVGNAREWAVAQDQSLLALGGAHTDPRAECRLDKSVPHQGIADAVTGFRLVREIQIKKESLPGSELASSGSTSGD